MKRQNQPADAVKVIFVMPADYARGCVATIDDAGGSAGTQMRLDERGGRWSKVVRLRPGEKIRFRYGIGTPDGGAAVCAEPGSMRHGAQTV